MSLLACAASKDVQSADSITCICCVIAGRDGAVTGFLPLPLQLLTTGAIPVALVPLKRAGT